MGELKKRGQIWWVRYYRNGRRHEESSHSDTREDAVRLLKVREGDVARGLPVTPKIGRLRFDEAAEDVLNDYRVNGKRSLDDVQRRFTLHLTPFFGGRRLSTVTTPDVRVYVAQRQAAGASNATVNRELTVLKRAFSLALQSGKLLAKPHIPMLRENNARTGFFEADQLASVLAHLPAPIQPVIRFAAITGWRIADEVLPLEWRQVDFAAGEVRLDVGTTSEGRVFTTKNDEGRVFPITEELRAVLDTQHAEHLRLKQAGQIVPWVFFRLVAQGRGGATQPKRILRFNKAWKTACAAAGAPGRIPHDLRRTAVRNLVRAGIPERVAMMMTGHKTRSVFERYNIVSSGDLKAAARSMDAFSTKPAGTPKTSGQGQFQGQSHGRRRGLPAK
jgi:integrase